MNPAQTSTIIAHDKQLTAELHDLGVGWWAWWHSEVGHLSAIIDPGERIGGIVYGYQGLNFVALVATDRRVIFLDSKPLFTDEEEITYDVVSGIRYDHLIFTTLTLHTRVRDYQLLTFNNRCALGFKHYIEQRVLEHMPANA